MRLQGSTPNPKEWQPKRNRKRDLRQERTTRKGSDCKPGKISPGIKAACALILNLASRTMRKNSFLLSYTNYSIYMPDYANTIDRDYRKNCIFICILKSKNRQYEVFVTNGNYKFTT